MNKTRIIMVLVTLLLAMPVASATDWQQFQKDEVKTAMSNASAIVGSGPAVTWSKSIGSFFAAPIAHGGFVYASNGNGLHKYYYNGTSAPGSWPTGAGATYGSPAYGNETGRIFFYGPFIADPPQQTIKGVNENDPADIWTVSPPDASGDAWGIFKSEITYAINKTGTKSIYFGDFGDRMYCYDVGGTDFDLRWNTTGVGAQFWAGVSVIGDYVVFGNQSGWVTCLNESDGAFVDAIHINHGNIKSSISWSNGHIFFTSYGGHLSKVGFNTTTGEFGTEDSHYLDSGSTTTTPAIYNGRVYVSRNHAVRCLHESNLTQIWDSPITSTFALQSSPALAMRDGYVYAYVTMNDVTGGVICINDTGPTGVQEWRDNTVGSYSMQGVAIAHNETGTWIFTTSQGGCKLAGHWASNPPPRKPDLNVTAIENSTIYAGTCNIIKATIKNGGNASATGFNATLKVGTTVVDEISVGDLDAGQSTVVKFVWTPTATGPYTLNVTADSDCTVNEWDETNNSLLKGVSAVIIPATDLAVIEVNDCDLANGEENTVFAVIENRGADVSGFNVTLKVGGTEVDTVFVPMLYFRDSQLVAFNWTPTTTGTKNLNVTIENGGYITRNVDVVDPISVSESVSIQSAIDSAGANDITIIRVESGTYNETVTIPAGKLIKLVANASDVVICNNTGDIVTIEGTDCYVEGFGINSTISIGGEYANWAGAGINVTPAARWNVIEDNYIYNTSGGITLYGSKNLIRCNTVGESAVGRSCLNLMAISGDCNAIVKNKFDGDTGNGWVLGGTYTAGGMVEADAFNNTVRGNNFTVTDVGGWECGDLVFGGDPNLVFDNIINDADSSKVELGRLNWYNVTKAAVEAPTMGNVVHGPYYGGNYWAGYTGSDSDYDLLGDTDTPYRGVDSHPLVRAKCGDVNCNGLVNTIDLGLVKQKVNHPPKTLCCAWAGDVNNCDGYVNSIDIGLLKQKVNHPPKTLNCCKGCEL